MNKYDYLQAKKAWKLAYAEHSQLIRNLRLAFKAAQQEYSKRQLLADQIYEKAGCRYSWDYRGPDAAELRKATLDAFIAVIRAMNEYSRAKLKATALLGEYSSLKNEGHLSYLTRKEKQA
jgi:hypothetical protein